jgi:HAD superfamily hydrolase (TIGR01490 family)
MRHKKTQKLAVFDIDGTIFRSSLAIELIRGLVTDSIFPVQAIKEMEKDYEAWVNRKAPYDNYVKKVLLIYVKYIKGCKQKQVEQSMDKIVVVQKDRLYRYTRDLVKELRKKNYFLLAISNSPTYIVSKFAKTLGFDASFGSIYMIDDGAYTGVAYTFNNNLKNKADVLRFFLGTHKQRFNLDQAIAVGDTETDIPMLSAVGHPIAFNPNDKLAEYAKKKNWAIVVERKNVIYELNNFKFLQKN